MALTSIPVTALLAGPRLNALVAEKVMGWHRWVDPGETDYEGPYPMFAGWGDESGLLAVYNHPDGNLDFYFNPSGNIRDAWRLVEKLTPLNLQLYQELSPRGEWIAEFRHWSEPPRESLPMGTTAMLVICRAALLAVGVTEVEGG
jgi:hypothetical protein